MSKRNPKVVQISAVSTPDGPTLFVLSEDGQIMAGEFSDTGEMIWNEINYPVFQLINS